MTPATPVAPVLTAAGRRILDAASDLFYRKGIHAVGVDAIVSAAQVTKKTLYDRFGSKDALVTAYLRERDARWRSFLTEDVAANAHTPRARLLRTFDALAGWMQQVAPRGCAFVNALAELPDPGHPGRAVIAGQKRWLAGYLAELAADTDAAAPRALAEQLLLLHEGAVVAYAGGALDAPVVRARQAAAVLIDRA